LRLARGSKICPVLKSNAYGHGLELVGKWLEREIKPELIAVDSLYEAYRLEKAGIRLPVIILGYTMPENFKILKRLKFRLPIYDEETLKVLNRWQPGAKVHLKIDTGMSRLGIRWNEARKFVKKLKRYRWVKIEGIYTHLGQVEDGKQVERFKKVIEMFEKEGFKFKWKHVLASNGVEKIFDSEFNLIRLGLEFYARKPALKLLTRLIQVKTINKGDWISYDGIYKVKKKMKIGVLPLGYYDGLDRRLSNKGKVKIAGKECQILGRVCMNLTIIDLSRVEKPLVGQEVVVYEDIKKSARLAGTIPYDLLVGLSETTKRVLVD
jgi:alanine racemase